MLRSEYNIATSEFTTYDSIEMHIYIIVIIIVIIIIIIINHRGNAAMIIILLTRYNCAFFKQFSPAS